MPALHESRRLRQIVWITFRRASVHPSLYRVHLPVSQTCVVGKAAVMGVREPGWHLASEHSLADGLGPRTRGLVVQQGHGSNVIGAMACRAPLIKNGSDVLAERGNGENRRRH